MYYVLISLAIHSHIIFLFLGTSVSNATSVLSTPNTSSMLQSITVTCNIHPESTADHCEVMAMADGGVTETGIGPVTNTMATVTVDGLECGVTYTIIAGGTLNGDLVGPRSSYRTITTNPCPVCPATSKIYRINEYSINYQLTTCLLA